MNRLYVIIASLFIITLFSCAKPVKTEMPVAQTTETDEEFYGNAYGIKIAEDEFKAGNYGKALDALNQGLWFLRKANLTEKCGASRTRCIIYKIYGLYLRAQIHAMDEDSADKALEDLNWIHENGFMRHIVNSYKFWDEKNFNSLKSNRDFQRLVNIYNR